MLTEAAPCGIIKSEFCADMRRASNSKRRTLTVTVTKQTVIGEVLDYDMETARFFFEIGMHCLGCPASRGESIEDACAVHGTNADELVAKLNAYFASKN